MWLAICDFLATTLAVTCCALAVKLTDDWLDQEHDRLAGRKNWAEILGIGTMLYAMIFLIIAAALNTAVSLALFLASYIIGMFHDLTSRFPLGFTGWQESLFILVMSVVLFGWHITLFSLIFVIGIQLIDDCLDITTDSMAGQRNFAAKLGQTECILLSLLALLGSWWINEDLFLPVLAGTLIGWGGIHRFTVVKRYA